MQKNGTEYIWQADKKFWSKHSPVLFPIIGSLKGGAYEYDGKQYQLSRHGFARDREFRVIESSLRTAIFELRDDEVSLDMYPFTFALRIIYTVEDFALRIGYEIENTGVTALPFSIGAHPAFALQGNISDYSLDFGTDNQLFYHLLKGGLIADDTHPLKTINGKLRLSWDLFRDDALIFKQLVPKTVVIEKDDKPYIEVVFPLFEHLGLWTVPGAQFLCIEPWTGYADVVSATGRIIEKESITWLGAGETFKTNFGIRIF